MPIYKLIREVAQEVTVSAPSEAAALSEVRTWRASDWGDEYPEVYLLGEAPAGTTPDYSV